MQISHRKFTVKTLAQLIVACTLIFMLGSCASTHPSSSQAFYSHPHFSSWQARSLALSNIKQWTLQGAMGVQYRNTAHLINVSWQQQPQQYQIMLAGPLNFGSVKIIGNSQGVTLWRSAKQPISANTPEALLNKTLGWHLPVTDLYYWIRGLPVPHAPAITQLDPDYRLLFLQQQGWQIHYFNYQPVNGIELPQKVELINVQRDLKIRLVLKHWSL